MFHWGRCSARKPREERVSSSPEEKMSLTELAAGRTAVVLGVRGGAALEGRLAALGIVPGAVIVKKSAKSARGPVIVEKGAVKLALGYGLGQCILVEEIR
jgi:ferrous iron transport protein A